ncbi:hypothetical protein BH10BAC2_BH10BAC2_32200 [soil metagenome]
MGKWLKLNDTLYLTPVNDFDKKRKELQQTKYLFIIKDGKLFPVALEAAVVGNIVMALDFLENEKK